MIHYTLLPEKEIKALKREYRMRLVIFFLFFMSVAVLVGIFSLAPAFVISYTQEKEALEHLKKVEKNRKDKGLDSVVKELSETNLIIKKLEENTNDIVFSKVIFKIIGYKTNGLTIKSFDVSKAPNATSTVDVVIQGKASTRDSLISFKNKLESDPLISNLQLPVSDLAKSKDISYSIKISIIGKYEN
jgi:hypothetical protein